MRYKINRKMKRLKGKERSLPRIGWLEGKSYENKVEHLINGDSSSIRHRELDKNGLKMSEIEEAPVSALKRMQTHSSIDSNSDQAGEVCLISHSPYWIFKVSARGNLSEVKRLYKSNAKSGLLTDQKGNTPLHHASRGNHIKLVEFILTQEVDVDAVNHEGNTSLHLAVETSSPEALLEFETVDKDQLGNKGSSPIHYAAIYDKPECAQILLEHGVRMCQKNSNGYYPIHSAAYHASAKTIEVFIKYAVEIQGYTREFVMSLKDADNNTPLHAAVNSSDIEAMRVCLKAGALVDAQQEDKSTPVHYASSQGNATMIEVMLELQKDRMKTAIKLKDGMGMTPLHRAAIFDHTNVVNILLGHGADLNCRDSQLRTPVLVAASKASWNTVVLLIQRGADLTLKDKDNRNFVHILIESGLSLADLQDTKTFDLKKQLNEPDFKGCTPLHYASRKGFLHVIDDLINFGAAVNAKNNDNESPFHFAAKYGRYNTCRLLLNSKLGPYVVNEKDGMGRTALHLAAGEGHDKIVSLLLQKGCSPIRCFMGNTPLHMAAMNGYTHCMRSILIVHANLIDSTNKEGDTALHLAAKEGQAGAVSLLLTAGANMPQNNEGKTFIDLVIQCRYECLANSIISHSRWKEVMECQSVYGATMLGLVELLPNVCLTVLDRCQTHSNHDKLSCDFKVTFNFKYLQDDCYFTKEKKTSSDDSEPMKVMNKMVKHGRVDCLSHAVCSNYIKMKWNSYGIWLHMTNLIIYLVFLSLLTWFVVEYRVPTQDKAHMFTFNASNSSVYDICREKPKVSKLSRTILIFLNAYVLANIFKEFIQMSQQKQRYFLERENLLEWALYVSTAIFAAPFIFGHCSSYQWEAATVAVFLAWFNLLLFLQRFELFGLYIVMFIEILSTLIKVVCVFSILIVAFGLAFFILMADDGSHKTHRYPGLSMVRATMMMLELDYMASFNDPYTDDDSYTLPFPLLSIALLVIFVLLMPILLMNLLIGLAVGDIESVQRNARLKRLAMQVDMHSDFERKLPRRFLDKVEKSEYSIHPNCSQNRLIMLVLQMTSGLLDDGDRTDLHQTLAHAQLVDELNKQKNRLKKMSTSMEKQHDLLRLLVQKMNIKSEDDFLDEGLCYEETSEIDKIKEPSAWSSHKIRTELMRETKVLSKWKQTITERSIQDSIPEN